jgi:hypothetical protein
MTTFSGMFVRPNSIVVVDDDTSSVKSGHDLTPSPGNSPAKEKSPSTQVLSPHFWGVSDPARLSSSTLHFSNYSFLVHHPVNRDGWHLLAHAMASDGSFPSFYTLYFNPEMGQVYFNFNIAMLQ